MDVKGSSWNYIFGTFIFRRVGNQTHNKVSLFVIGITSSGMPYYWRVLYLLGINKIHLRMRLRI